MHSKLCLLEFRRKHFCQNFFANFSVGILSVRISLEIRQTTRQNSDEFFLTRQNRRFFSWKFVETDLF